MGSLQLCVEAADERGVGKRSEHIYLSLEVSQRLLLLHLVWSDQLRDGKCEQGLISDQVDLVAVAAADGLQRQSPRVDLGALFKLPGCGFAHLGQGSADCAVG